MGLGIYVLGSEYGAKEVSTVLGNDLYQVAAYVLIATGALLVIMSICGCCGAHRESKCMLGVVSIAIHLRQMKMNGFTFSGIVFAFFTFACRLNVFRGRGRL